MTDRDRIRAQIDARLTQLGETINTIRLRAESQRDKFGAPIGKSLDEIESKRSEVRRSLQEMDSREEDDVSATIDRLSGHLDDIDASLRQALAYFK